jgi:potassium-transporting ATPase KdpC subunit
MKAHLRANLVLLGLTVAGCAVLYPLAVLTVGQTLFPTNANGSLVTGPDGTAAGSRLVAQEFNGDEWFHPRPSACGYNAAVSGGSNMSANNPKLRERVVADLRAFPADVITPADAVTASGSGLDPHTTLQTARAQVGRVVAARATGGRAAAQVRETVEGILRDAAFEPLAGLVGSEPLVNVLEVNLELARRLPNR